MGTHTMSFFAIFLLFTVAAVSASPVSPQPRADPEYRLPLNVVPDKYAISLKLDTDAFQTNQFSGQVAITLRVLEATNQIQLHAMDLDITLLELTFGTTKIDVTIEIDELTNILTVASPSVLVVGTYILSATYTSSLSLLDMHGLYKSSYRNENGVVEYLASTQFEATHARRAFPCFDEPSFKAQFVVTFTYPQGYTAVANTPANAPPQATSDGLETVTFVETPIMSTYLLSFIISKFTSTEGVAFGEGVPYKVWSRSQVASQRALAVDVGPKLIKVLEDYTGISYASMNLNKMDQFAIPDFSAGAMENWGLVTYRETSLLWEAQDSSTAYQQSIENVIAHEFAHMWFGNLVTLNWWSDTFLNEGFARYCQYFCTAQVEPNWELDRQFVVAQVHTALAADSSAASQALSSPVSTPAQISSRFGTVSYNKGATILRMIKHFIGEDNLQQGIRAYLNTYKSKNTIPENLWNSITPFAPTNLPATFNTVINNWIVEAGYPILTVKSEGNAITVTQERYLTSGTSTTKWYIPITLATASIPNFENTTPLGWLTPTSEFTIVDTNTWVVLNNQQTSYYRTNYSENLWERISEALNNNPNDIHALNRAQIVDDLFTFAWAQKLSYPFVFNITTFLAKDTDYYVWYAAINGFNAIIQNIGDNNIRNALNKHALGLLNNLYTTVGFDKIDETNHAYSMKQALGLRWACEYGDENCIQNATSIFAGFRDQNTNVYKNFKNVVYCNAIRQSNNDADWNFLWERLTQTQLATEEITILSALGCSKHASLLNKLLSNAVNESSIIRRQDSRSVFTYVINGNPDGVAVAFDFVIENYEQVLAYYQDEDSVISLVQSLVNRFTVTRHGDKLEEFSKNDKLSDRVRAALEASKQSLANRLRFIEQLENNWADILQVQRSSASSQGIGSVLIVTLLITWYQLFY